MMTSKEYEAMTADYQTDHPEPPPGYVPPQAGYQPAYVYNQQPGMSQTAPMMVVMSPRLQNPPPDHLLFNVIVTLFCCWPIGIFAILKSIATRDAINRGDGQEALGLSRSAKRLGFWTLGVGIAFMVLTVAAVVIIYAVWLIPAWTKMSRH